MTRLYDNGATNSTAKALKDTFLQISPLSFLRSGYYDYSGGAPTGQASSGYYWSGRFYSITNSYYLGFNSANLSPQNGLNRGYGFTVRCLAR